MSTTTVPGSNNYFCRLRKVFSTDNKTDIFSIDQKYLKLSQPLAVLLLSLGTTKQYSVVLLVL